MPRITGLLTALMVATMSLLAGPALTAHAADEKVVWTLSVDGPRTVDSGGTIAVRVDRSAPGPEVTARIYAGSSAVDTVTMARGTTDWRTFFNAPSVTKTRVVTLWARAVDGSWATSATVTVTAAAPTAAKIGPNGFRKSRAADREYLLDGAYRWAPCRAIAVSVPNRGLRRAVGPAVRNLRALAGVALVVTAKPLRGYGIAVRRADLPGRVAGMGGIKAVDDGRIIRGTVRIDVPAAGRHLIGVMTHELAHALGVDHSPRSSGDLMSAHGSSDHHPTGWDRRALRYAGQGAC